jgi:hypothetical protein
MVARRLFKYVIGIFNDYLIVSRGARREDVPHGFLRGELKKRFAGVESFCYICSRCPPQK